MDSFEYSPLDRTTRNIRLLQFEAPPPGSDVVCCSLETYDLDSCPPFAALSYAWGEPGGCKDIFLEWATFSVRQNLHAALCSMRYFDRENELSNKIWMALTDFACRETNLPTLIATLKGCVSRERWQTVVRKVLATACTLSQRISDGVERLPAYWELFYIMMGREDAFRNDGDYHTLGHWRHRHYWVDALCIDQQNDAERGHQVNFMGDIYRRADCVLAWLGPSTEASDRIMRTVASGTRECSQGGGPTFDKRGRDYEEAVKDLAERPYWHRLWTAQEFILAQDVNLVCGHHRMPFDRLLELLFDGDNPIYTRLDLSTVQRIVSRTWWRETETVTLDMLLWRFRSAHCSDPRDRVYGLLALLRNHARDSPHIEPDYSISERQLYHRLISLYQVRRTSADTSYLLHGFWADLREALTIPEGESFDRNDFLYEIVAGLGASCPDDPAVRVHRNLLEELGLHSYSHAEKVKDYGSRDPREIYQEIMGLFAGFPKAEDPKTWETFDTLLRAGLGLSAHNTEGVCV